MELEEQARNLANEDCTQLQGYLFSKPQPAAEIPRILERLAGLQAAHDEQRLLPASGVT